MNKTGFGRVVATPSPSGMGFVAIDGVRRACYFAPERFKAPWPTPATNDRVAVTIGKDRLVALYLLGQGTPAP